MILGVIKGFHRPQVLPEILLWIPLLPRRGKKIPGRAGNNNVQQAMGFTGFLQGVVDGLKLPDVGGEAQNGAAPGLFDMMSMSL